MKLAAVVVEEHKMAAMNNVDTSDCVSYILYNNVDAEKGTLG
jgi:hypothetical protein